MSSGITSNIGTPNNDSISLSEIESLLGVPILEVIPEDINVQKSIAKMKPVVQHKPKSKASKRFKRVASKILGEPVTKTKQNWIDRLLFWL